MKIKLLSFVFFVVFSLPIFVSASEYTNNSFLGINPPSQNSSQRTHQLFAQNKKVSEPIKLVNPLKTTDSIEELVRKILRYLLIIAVPILVMFIIYSGFMFVTAQGNSDKLTKAKNNLLYVLVGAGILLAAYVIAETIVETVKLIKGS